LGTNALPEGAGNKVSGGLKKMGSYVRKTTSNLLTKAWINLIDTFGLTLIYIHLHVFMRLVMGSDFFCKLGHEWFDVYAAKVETVLNSSDNDINSFARRQLNRLKEMTGLLEVIVLLIIDLLIILAIVLALVLSVFVIASILAPVLVPVFIVNEIVPFF
jgi:hypothetical protein